MDSKVNGDTMKKSQYRKYCNNPNAITNAGYKNGNGKHYFAGVESSNKDTVSTVTGGKNETVVARISTWKGAIEITASIDGNDDAFRIDLVPHAGVGNTEWVASGHFGDKRSLVVNEALGKIR